MANKKISELVSRTPSLTDLMLVGDPSSGYSYKCTITELSTLLEANITLNDLNDVVITAPTNGQVLTYNGTNWVNGNNGITEINGLTATSQSFSVGTSGTDFAIVSSTSTHTFNLPTASATNRGALSSADWSTFNSKIGGSGTTNYIPKFTSSSAIGNSSIYEDASGNIGIGTTTPHFGNQQRWVNVASSDIAGFQANGNGNTSIFRLYSVGNSGAGNGVYFGSVTNDFINIFTNNINRVRITASGDFGIGTTSPAAKLDVNGVAHFRDSSGIFSDRLTAYSGGNVQINYGASGNLIVGSGSAGAERMRLDASGNLGIGTLSPAVKLDIAQSSSGSTVELLRLQNTGVGANTSARLNFYAASTNYGSITGGYGSSSPELIFDINSANGIFRWRNNTTEQMRLDASGNLGIGTSSPVSKFETFDGDISVTTQNSFSFFNANRNFIPNASGVLLGGLKFRGYSTGTTYQVGSQIYGYSSAVWTSTSTPSYLSFQTTPSGSTSPTERMIIDASGNVGIGTSSPSTDLHISKAGSTTLRVTNTNNSTNVELGIATALGFVGTKSDNSFAFNTNDTERMRITSGGNVGIGTTSPVTNLQVHKPTTGLSGVQVTNSTTGSSISDGLFLGIDDSQAYVWNYENTATVFATNSTERMRITSGGNVLIGTSTAGDYGLRVDVGTNNHSATFLNNTSGYATLQVVNTTAGTTKDFITFRTAVGSTTLGDISGTSTQLQLNGITNLVLATSSTERMRITSGGEVLINTTSDAGDFKLQVNGNSYIGGELYIKAASGYNVLFQNSATTLRLNYLNDAGSANISAAYRATDFNWQDGSGNQMFLLNSSGNAEFASSLKIGGNFTTPISIKTGNYTLGASDYTVVFDIGGDRTATLPDATTCTGRIYTIKANVSNTSTLTIDGNGSQTIDGNTTLDLNCKGSVIIQSDGSNWRILSIYLDGSCL